MGYTMRAMYENKFLCAWLRLEADRHLEDGVFDLIGRVVVEVSIELMMANDQIRIGMDEADVLERAPAILDRWRRIGRQIPANEILEPRKISYWIDRLGFRADFELWDEAEPVESSSQVEVRMTVDECDGDEHWHAWFHFPPRSGLWPVQSWEHWPNEETARVGGRALGDQILAAVTEELIGSS